MKIDWKQKLTSRKLWMAVAGFVTGLILLFTQGATDTNVTGCIMAVGSVISYIIGEGIADASHTTKGGEKDDA